MWLTTVVGGEHHLTIPNRDSLWIGTLNAILRDVACHAGLTRDGLFAHLAF